MDCSLPGSIREIFQARILEWVAISFSREPKHALIVIHFEYYSNNIVLNYFGESIFVT